MGILFPELLWGLEIKFSVFIHGMPKWLLSSDNCSLYAQSEHPGF